MDLHTRLAALELVEIPVWVIDVAALRILWGNAGALTLWRAATLAELQARDFGSMSETSLARLRHSFSEVCAGRGAQETWTIYPRGKPVALLIRFSRLELEPGAPVMLAQALQQHVDPEPEQLRSVEALRYSSVLVVMCDQAGAVLMLNPAARQTFGEAATMHGCLGDARLAAQVLATTAQGQEFHLETLSQLRSSEHWFAIAARPTTDPVTGQPATLLQLTDVTSRRLAEEIARTRGELVKDLESSLALVEQQRQQILSLSAPILDIGGQTLALPLIGYLDAARSNEIAARLLDAVIARRARTVILDLTSMDTVDRASAAQLGKLLRAVGLLGARSLVTGVRAEVAKLLVTSGADISGLRFEPKLRDGIEICLGLRSTRDGFEQ